MKSTTANSTFAIGGVFPKQVRDKLCSADTFLALAGLVVQGGNSVLRIKFSANKPAHRQAVKRLPIYS
jgi:hypothetical protein